MKVFKNMKIKSFIVTALLLVSVVPATTIMAAQATVNLGTTSGFAVLAHEAITNTGATTINGSVGSNVGGDVGLYPGTSFTGQADVTISGKTYLTDDVAKKAQEDLAAAYKDAAGRKPTRIATELGEKTLKSGTYDSASGTFEITGKLTLDAEGDPNAVFIFQTESTLNTLEGSSVILKNGARFCRVFWKVGSSATLGTDSKFVGHILAMVSITAKTHAQVQGQLLARTGAVTLDSNKITNGICDNTPELATLQIIKQVINDNGGRSVAAKFNIHVKTLGNDVVASPSPGSELGTTYTLTAGAYAVSEDAFDGYTSSYSGDSDSKGNIILAPGENKTVTITNNDIANVSPPSVGGKATLHVIKHVINDSGRTTVASNFNIHVKTLGKDVAESPAPGSETGTTYTLPAGTYTVSEESFAGYTKSYSGDSDSKGNITLKPGENKTVTITNNDTSETLPQSSGDGKPVVITHTVTGGQIPDTASSQYWLLLIGTVLTLLGAIIWKSGKRYE